MIWLKTMTSIWMMKTHCSRNISCVNLQPNSPLMLFSATSVMDWPLSMGALELTLIMKQIFGTSRRCSDLFFLHFLTGLMACRRLKRIQTTSLAIPSIYRNGSYAPSSQDVHLVSPWPQGSLSQQVLILTLMSRQNALDSERMF